MNAWPSTLPTPSWGLTEEFYKPQLITPFDANYSQSRPKTTRGIDRWGNLGWTIMTEAEYQTLRAFFDANQGNLFSFTHPMTGRVYTCHFTEDSIKSDFGGPGFRENVQCPIEEV